MTSRRRFLATVGSGALTSGLAGCGYRPGAGDWRWRVESPGGLFRTESVGVADGVIYGVARSTTTYDLESEDWTDGGQVSAYGTDDGRERLSKTFGTDIAASAAGETGLAVGFGGPDGGQSVGRLDADGVRWRTPVRAEPLVVAPATDRTYAVTSDRRLVALADGSRAWSVELPGEPDGSTGGGGEGSSGDGTGGASDDERASEGDAAADDDPLVRASLAADAGVAVAVTESGAAAFDPDGRRRWTRPDIGAWESVVVTDGPVLLPTRRELFALDRTTGETLWTLLGEVDSVANTDEGGYTVGDGTVVAFDASGETRWTATAGGAGERYRGRVAATDDDVFANRRGTLVALDAADGRVRWTAAHDEISAGPFVADGGVLVAADDDLVCHYR